MKVNLVSAKDLGDLVKKLTTLLTNLSFEDNITSFKQENITIASGKNVTVRNKLTFVPSQYIITSQIGNSIVTKGVNQENGKGWDINSLYLYNNGPSEVTITVIFMR